MKKFACLMVLVLVGTLMIGGCKKKEEKPAIPAVPPAAAPIGQ